MATITSKQYDHARKVAKRIKEALPDLSLYDLIMGTNWIAVGCEMGGWDETIQELNVE